jgi:D-amino peptidase
MKIYISSDMEGTAGVVDWSQVMATGSQYPCYTDLLTKEINAAIEGAMKAGATEFLVNDAHSRMANLRPEDLAGSARYLSGRMKPMYMMQGLDETFDAVFFISYHGSMGSQSSTLSHTYFPSAFSQVSINGIVTGEAGINALVALGYGVPVVLITGDATTAEEIEPFCPGAQAAIVKESVSRFSASSMHPQEARALISHKAFDAVKGIGSAVQVNIELPATMTIDFTTSDYADLASRVSGFSRTGVLSGAISNNDPIEIYRTFITIVLLCRGLGE